MAIWRSSLRQTSANDAAVIVAAELSAGLLETQDEVSERYFALVADIFEDLEKQAIVDDKAYEDKADAAPAKGKGRAAKTGGGNRGRSGGKSSTITVEDAMSLVMNSGVFEGETLEDISGFTAEYADENYGYGDGERSGLDYISWLASEKNKNDFTRARAEVVAKDLGI